MTIGAQFLNVILGTFTSIITGLVNSIFTIFVDPLLNAIAAALGLSA